MKKKTIHFSNEDLSQIGILIDLLGIKGTYGDIPKALRLSVTFAIKSFEKLNKVIPDLDEPELDMLFMTIKKMRKEAKRQKELENLQKNPEK